MSQIETISAARRKGRAGRSQVVDPDCPIPYSQFCELQGWSSKTGLRREAAGLPVIRREGMRPMVVPALANAWLRNDPIPKRRGRPVGSGKGSK
jgi:hypothetical protein